jgi:hypothetical protein
MVGPRHLARRGYLTPADHPPIGRGLAGGVRRPRGDGGFRPGHCRRHGGESGLLKELLLQDDEDFGRLAPLKSLGERLLHGHDRRRVLVDLGRPALWRYRSSGSPQRL